MKWKRLFLLFEDRILRIRIIHVLSQHKKKENLFFFGLDVSLEDH